VSPIDEAKLRRYTSEALEIAIELLKSWNVPDGKKAKIVHIEQDAALQVAQGIFALWEDVPDDVAARLRNFRAYMNEIKRIKEGFYGSENRNDLGMPRVSLWKPDGN
jgi:hypothetical protein